MSVSCYDEFMCIPAHYETFCRSESRIIPHIVLSHLISICLFSIDFKNDLTYLFGTFVWLLNSTKLPCDAICNHANTDHWSDWSLLCFWGNRFLVFFDFKLILLLWRFVFLFLESSTTCCRFSLFLSFPVSMMFFVN